jgi:hypothetical protein
MKVRVEVVSGPHKTLVFEHELSEGVIFRVHPGASGALGRALAKLRGQAIGRPVLYRIFSRAAPDDSGADVYAAEWCAEHAAFADRCPHAPDRPTRRWVRFGPRTNQTQLLAGSPGTRESKWHALLNWRQVEEPWVAVCELVVYGPIVEEYRHEVLTPIGSPTCKGCKAKLGLTERGPGLIAVTGRTRKMPG